MERIAEKFKGPATVFLAIILLILAAFSIQNAFRNLALESFLARLFPTLVVPFVVILITIIIANIINQGWRNIWKPSFFIQSIFVAVLLTFINIIFYPIYISFLNFIEWIEKLDNDIVLRQYVVGSAALFSGIVLFLFRLYFRSTYGFTEAVVGIGIAVHKVSGSSVKLIIENIDLFVVFLTASVYLVVRGLDNIHQGLVKDPKDPIVDAILRRIFKIGKDANESVPSTVEEA